MDGLYKCGHVDVKFPSKSRRITRKVWRRRWMVLSPMSDLAAEKYMAKLDIYQDSDSFKKAHIDKVSILLENVTDIKSAKSKSHPYALEVCEGHSSPICLSGDTESDTDAWGWTLRQIFWPNNNEWYDVTLIDNSHSARINLQGSYRLNVTTQSICLMKPKTASSYTWSLSSLKRFYIDAGLSTSNHRVIVFEAGPQSESGEGTFLFESTRADSILQTIRENISIALVRDQASLVSRKESIRSLSISSTDTMTSVALGASPQGSVHINTTEEEDMLNSNSSISTMIASSFEDSVVASQGAIANKQSNLRNRKVALQRLSETDDDIMKKRIKSHSIEQNRLIIHQKNDLDDDGYSQITASPILPDTIDKLRTLSSISFKSRASDSISSRDSGVIFSSPEPPTGVDDVDVSMDIFRDVSNSFDSAISTTSNNSYGKPRGGTPDTRSAVKDILTAQPIRFENLKHIDVQNEDCMRTNPFLETSTLNRLSSTMEATTTDSQNEGLQWTSDSESSSSVHIYNDIDCNKMIGDSNSIPTTKENDYEDLDKFRKNLNKFFGTNVSQSDPPPRLPDRNRNNNGNLMSTMPRMSNKISTRDEEDINDVIARIDRWPLGLSSKARENSIYSQSAKVYRRTKATDKSESLYQFSATSSLQSVDLLTGEDLLEAADDSLITVPSFSPFGIETPNSQATDFTWSNADVFDATWATHTIESVAPSALPINCFNDSLISLPIMPTGSKPSVRLSSSAEDIDINRWQQEVSACANSGSSAPVKSMWTDFTADNGPRNEYSRFPNIFSNTISKNKSIKKKFSEICDRRSFSPNGQYTSGPSPSEWIKRLENSQNKQNEVYIAMKGGDDMQEDANDEYVAPADLLNK